MVRKWCLWVAAEAAGPRWLLQQLRLHPQVIVLPPRVLLAAGDARSALVQWMRTDVRTKALGEAFDAELRTSAPAPLSAGQILDRLAALLSSQDLQLLVPLPVEQSGLEWQKAANVCAVSVVQDGRTLLAELHGSSPDSDQIRNVALGFAAHCTAIVSLQETLGTASCVLRWEQFLADPSRHYGQVLSVLGLNSSPLRQEPGGAALQSGELSANARLELETLVGPLLRLFGYSLDRENAVDPAGVRARSSHEILEILDGMSFSNDACASYYRDHRERYALTLELLYQVEPGETVLELGAAFHHLTPYLIRDLGCRVICHDRRAAATQVQSIPLDGQAAAEVPVHSYDLERDLCPLADDSVDWVLCCEILEHLKVDPMHMLLEIHRVLRPGGKLVLTTPNAASAHSLEGLLRGDTPHVYGHYEVHGEPEDRHNREYTPKEVRSILESAGFDVQLLKTAPSWWPTNPDTLSLLQEHGYDTQYRDDNIFVVAANSREPKERYPAEFYLNSGTQVAWREQPEAPEFTKHTGKNHRLLVVHEHAPQTDRSGSDVRLFRLLETLIRQGHEVTFLGRQSSSHGAYVRDLQELGISVVDGDRNFASWYHDEPAAPVDLARLLEERRIDTAILFHWYWTGISVAEHYLPALRQAAPDVRVVVLSDDVHYLREERLAGLSGSRLDLERARCMKVRESQVYAQADAVWSITGDDAARMQNEQPDLRLGVVGHVHDAVPAAVPGWSARRDLLFVGSGRNQANHRAVAWFLEHVWPKVAEACPDLWFHVAGEPPEGGWKDPPPARVTFHGKIHDLSSLLQRSLVFVSPIPYGTGLKTKNILALSNGLPLVTTTIGAEGMPSVKPAAFDVEDEPGAFARRIIALVQERSLWQDRSKAAVAYVKQHFSRRQLEQDLTRGLELAGSAPLQPAAALDAMVVEQEHGQFQDVVAELRLGERAKVRIQLASHYQRSGDHQRALLELRSILLEWRGDQNWAGFTNVYTSLAHVYMAAGELEEARASANEALRLWPASKLAQHTLCMVEDRQSEPAGAATT